MCVCARLALETHCKGLWDISWGRKRAVLSEGDGEQISICGLVPVKRCNLFTKNKTFEIVKMEGLAGAAG